MLIFATANFKFHFLIASKIEAIVNQHLQRIDYDMSKYNWGVIAGQVSEIYQSLC